MLKVAAARGVARDFGGEAGDPMWLIHSIHDLSVSAPHFLLPEKATRLLSQAARCAQPPHGLMPIVEVACLITSPRPTGSSETNTGSRTVRRARFGFPSSSWSCVIPSAPVPSLGSAVVIGTHLGYEERELLR